MTPIAAIYPTVEDLDYLEASIRSIGERVGLVLVASASSGASGLSSVLARLASLSTPIEVLPMTSENAETALARMTGIAAERGFHWALVAESADVYDDEELNRILSFAQRHLEAGQFQVQIQHYWKSPNYRIDPPDPLPRTVLCRLEFGANALAVISIPPDEGICHSFAFAGATAGVLRNLSAAGVAPQSVRRWQRGIWEPWNRNPALRNLHPEQPERFRRATRAQRALLPETISGHPFLHSEVAGEPANRKPAASLMALDRGAGLQSMRNYIRAIAVTVPDDCELIICSADESVLNSFRALPGVTVVRTTAKHSLLDALKAGAAAARSDKLVFLTSDIHVEGDWIEGLIAALEQSAGLAVYQPVTHALQTSANDESWPHRLAIDFEQRRGRFYGQSHSNGPFKPEETSCWACARETLASLTESTTSIQVSDTAVFDRRRTEAGSTQPENIPGGMARATIVIPVYNNRRLTEQCLDSIFRHTPSGQFEVVVVDNGSTDDTWKYLQSLGPRVRAIRNRQNLYFARGSNRGGWAARSETIVFLNNDTIVKLGWLEELLRPLDKEPTIGIVGNKQLFPESHPICANRVWHAGMVVGENRIPWHIGYGFDPAHPAVNFERECAAVSGCCMAMRRTLFEELGGFDPHFQNGFEDVDLCLRASRKGHRVVYAPASEIVHLVSSSESRFDREESNLRKFQARWAETLVPDEQTFLEKAGLLSTGGPAAPRVGFVSTYNQKGTPARQARQLLDGYPDGSYVTLAEFGIADREPGKDEPHVIRCWDRAGTWYYPLLRWATTLDLDLIHVNFDERLFPPGFLELVQALKTAGKHLVFTIRHSGNVTPLLLGIGSLADAIAVETDSDRRSLIGGGLPSRKILTIRSTDAARYRELYQVIRKGATRATVSVHWEGPQLVNHSLALVNRELEMALLQNETVDLAISPVGADAFAGWLSPRFRALQSCYGRALPETDVYVRHRWPPDWTPPPRGRWVVIQPWEYGGLPEEWMRSINRDVDEVWAPSNFVRRLYVESGADPARVFVVPNGVDAEFFKPGVRPYPLQRARRFKFLFLGGTIHRKGIDVLLKAYSAAFTSTDDVSLVIKDSGTADVYRGQGFGEQIREAQNRENAPHILYLDRDLSDAEMAQLYNACDCLVHPYRGEGFALPVLEAMSCGLPVVVTGGGATDDFVDDRCGFRIPATRHVFGNRSISGLKTVADLWLLEPDVNALEETLLEVQRNPEAAWEKGRRARQTVENGWTWRHAARKAMIRLEALKTRPIRRRLRQVDAAILLDMPGHEIEPVVASLISNSYADLAILVRGSASEAPDLRRRYPGIELLEEGSVSSTLASITSMLRAPVLGVVTQPCRFSKHWVQQLTAAANASGQGPRIVVPWTEFCDPRIPESEFQARARRLWRERRGTWRNIEEIPAGCALLNWACLSMGTAATTSDLGYWLSELQSQGVPALLAEDTWVGLVSSTLSIPTRDVMTSDTRINTGSHLK